MINRLTNFCLKHRSTFFLLALLLLILGAYSWSRIPVEAYPELAPVTVQVTTQLPGLAAEEIEQQVTTPLERGLGGVPGLVTMRSSSTFGLSLITLVFQYNNQDYWIRDRVNTAIANVTLPPGVTPSLDAVSGSAGEIYRYTLESESKNLMQLSEIQHWMVIPALLQVAGVANVDNFGGYVKEFELEIDPNKLIHYGVNVNQMVGAINNNSGVAGGGRVTRGEQSYVIRGVGQVVTLKDIGEIVVTQQNGVPVFVRDLGQMKIGHQVREGILGKDKNPDDIEGIVDLLKYENQGEVMARIHACVNQLNAQLAPQGVHIVKYIDRSDLIQATIDNVTRTIVEGVLLVGFFLFLFLGSMRVALIVAATIPLALATVFILMHLFGMPANLLSLGAIDFGVIVDGAIVFTEAILSLRERKPKERLSAKAVADTADQVARPIFFSTLIIATAYFPLLLFSNAEGRLFRPMAFTVGFAILGALVFAFTLAPGLTYIALKEPKLIRPNRFVERLRILYQDALAKFLPKLPLAFAIAGVTLFAVVLLGATVGREFLPDLDEGSLWLQVAMPSGLSLDKASEMASELRHVVDSFPEVDYIVTQTGRNETGTDPWTPSHIESCVGLKPYGTWPDHESKAEFIQRLGDRMKQIPGMEIGISQPIMDMMQDVMGGSHSPLSLRIYGDDFKEMRRIGNQIVDVLHQTPGTGEASIFQEPPIPQIVVVPNRDAAARYGINVSDIMNLVQYAVGGLPVTQIYNGDRVHNITLHLPNDIASSPEKLGALVLTSSTGAQVPLSLVADVRMQSGESTIAHEQGQRELTIRVDNGGRALSQYLADAQKRIDAEVPFDHQHFQLQWAGQFENLKRAQALLILAMLLVLGVMGILLFLEFGTLRHTLLILGVVPLGLLGGLVALHVRGVTLNIATGVGFIALFGVAMQNGIIMVANIRRVRDSHSTLSAAVIAGAAERFRPILLTATVATFGMLPAFLKFGVGTDVQRGLATVVVGGLFIATLLTLFILPAFYFAIERKFEARIPAKREEEDL